MPRVAVVFAVAIAVCVAAAMSPSRTAAAPKQHHEAIYYTITLRDAAREPRLKAKPQQGKKVVMPASSVRLLHSGSQGSQGNAGMRKR